jgi:hypothetical protein
LIPKFSNNFETSQLRELPLQHIHISTKPVIGIFAKRRGLRDMRDMRDLPSGYCLVLGFGFWVFGFLVLNFDLQFFVLLAPLAACS